MTTDGPQIRAEHIGSLLRPKELTRAFRNYQANELTESEFRDIQDHAIREVVRLQQSVGLKVIGDGEFRRSSYWAHWVKAINGLDVAPALFKFHDDTGVELEFIAANCVAKLNKTAPISTKEFEFLKTTTSGTIKITMPSPSTLHFWRLDQTFEESEYSSDEEYMADLCTIYRQEIADLARLGCTYVQLDEVPLIMLANAAIREQVVEFGKNPDKLIDLYIWALNEAISARPANMTIGMHICRGNFKGKWLTQGGYETIAERVFGQVGVDVFCLEFDTERAGGFQALRFVPRGKKVVLGLISTKVPDLEDPADLCARIEEATQYVPLADLRISPQCGFASTVSGNPITLNDEVNKLQLVVDTAKKVWGEL